MDSALMTVNAALPWLACHGDRKTWLARCATPPVPLPRLWPLL
jgi:hypothetical protein